MKVTFLTGEYPPMQGGIADYTANLAHHLRKHRIQPSVLISQKYHQATTFAETQQKGNVVSQGRQLDQEGLALDSVPVMPTLKNWGYRVWPQVRNFLRRYPTDILHIQYQAAAFDLRGWINWLPWYLGREQVYLAGRRPKVVTTFHDLREPYLFPRAGGLRWQALLSLARASDAVICTNIEDASKLRSYRQHIYEIPLGNNVSLNPPHNYHRHQWRQWLGFDESAFVMAYFGFLNESKGGEDLIRVLATLVKQGLNAYLLIIGGSAGDSDPNNIAYAQQIRHLVALQNLKKRVIATGYVSKSAVSAHLLAADAALMPYRDGVSFRRTTLIAALGHGLPIISTTPTLNLPQIIPNKNMLLAPPGHVTALAANASRLAKDKALREQLAQGAKTLSGQFDWETIAKATQNVYHKLS